MINVCPCYLFKQINFNKTNNLIGVESFQSSCVPNSFISCGWVGERVQSTDGPTKEFNAFLFQILFISY